MITEMRRALRYILNVYSAESLSRLKNLLLLVNFAVRMSCNLHFALYFKYYFSSLCQ